jgi:hypothetical protein
MAQPRGLGKSFSELLASMPTESRPPLDVSSPELEGVYRRLDALGDELREIRYLVDEVLRVLASREAQRVAETITSAPLVEAEVRDPTATIDAPDADAPTGSAAGDEPSAVDCPPPIAHIADACVALVETAVRAAALPVHVLRAVAEWLRPVLESNQRPAA